MKECVLQSTGGVAGTYSGGGLAIANASGTNSITILSSYKYAFITIYYSASNSSNCQNGRKIKSCSNCTYSEYVGGLDHSYYDGASCTDAFTITRTSSGSNFTITFNSSLNRIWAAMWVG